jgi:hypothetical protein
VNGVFTQTFYGKFLGLLLVGASFLLLASSLEAAYRVTGLEVSAVDGSTAVTIEADAPPGFAYFTIGEPEPRLVVDFSDAVHGLPKYRFGNLESQLIHRIRTSQYRPYPQPVVRIVLDMPRLVPFQMQEEGNRLVIVLETPSDSNLVEGEPGKAPSQPPGSEVVETQAPSAEMEVQTPTEESDQVEEEHAMTPVSDEDSIGSGEEVADLPAPEKTTASQLHAPGIREPVSYSSGGRRDPFVPLPGGQDVEFGQAPLPNVEKLTIVGILRETDGYRALVQDADQNGYVLRNGDRVLYGYVASIEEQRVVFRLNRRGLDRTVILRLPQ